MTIARWGTVCGSRANLGWYITREGKNLLATNLQAGDFLFDSNWPKLGNVISAGTRTYTPTGVSTVVTWPTQATVPLFIAYWRKSTSIANTWTMATSAQGAEFAFTGEQGQSFYIDESKLVFHELFNNTTPLSVRWRVFDRATVPSGTPGAPRPRWILDTDGFYVTPPGITAKTAPASSHLFHPDQTQAQCIAAGTGTTSANGLDVSFNWSSYSGDYSVYATAFLGGQWTPLVAIQELPGNVLRIYLAQSGVSVKWAIIK